MPTAFEPVIGINYTEGYEIMKSMKSEIMKFEIMKSEIMKSEIMKSEIMKSMKFEIKINTQ